MGTCTISFSYSSSTDSDEIMFNKKDEICHFVNDYNIDIILP